MLQLSEFLVMIPMILSVGILYLDYFPLSQRRQLGKQFIGLLSIGFVFWWLYGYPLATGNSIRSGTTLTILIQFEFYAYALAMFSGTFFSRYTSKQALIFIPIWTGLVYCPIAWLLWANDGWLLNLGALDFSGGLVVHVTAGITSLVLGRRLLTQQGRFQQLPSTNQGRHIIAIGLITLGWFGFNAAPADNNVELIKQTVMNTFTAIGGSIMGVSCLTWWQTRKLQLTDITTGMLGGLVISTISVGYVTPLVSMLIAVSSSIGMVLLIQWSHQQRSFFDAVDSFAMNAGGAILATLAFMLVACWQRPAGWAWIELVALVVVSLITWLGTEIAIRITIWWPKIILEKIYNNGKKN
ncbi:ammonium transporter [Periweissella fabalis]|uniref:Ammonium transporter n=1 Tax=Periweissella fabalis TaxID=1070421 RepID=A0A7X6N0U0_9LACO|nr:ammonium transporter [Periweissella fabalis]MCM0599347.1 ammonium transporter [Periweissella fabalis]NKZ23626.1 ammonium transporter [Periweissella fabalis]